MGKIIIREGQGKLAGQGKLVVESPFHPAFPAKARAIGGKWNGRLWVFDARMEEQVRAAVLEVYGDDGSGGTPMADVVLECLPSDLSQKKEVWLLGRNVFSRMSRDSAVVCGDGVAILDGNFPASGGSRANPRIGEDGTSNSLRFKMLDVPVALLNNLDDSRFVVIETIHHTRHVDISASASVDLSAVSDSELIAELQKRGYVVYANPAQEDAADFVVIN